MGENLQAVVYKKLVRRCFHLCLFCTTKRRVFFLRTWVSVLCSTSLIC